MKAPFRAQNINRVLEKRGTSIKGDYRLGNLAPLTEPLVWLFKPYKIGTTLTDCFLKYGTGCFNPAKIKTNFIEYSSYIKDKKHETEKPLGLLEILVETFTLENQTILDPFMGSGTTGLACLNLNRNFIGIELNENYFEIANLKIFNKGNSF